MITGTTLNHLGENVFRTEKLAEPAELKNLDPSKIILCVKACDGTYHKVRSDVGDILNQHQTTLTNGGFQMVISKFLDEETHGQRFLVYPNGGEKAILIGNLFFGLKKLAKLK
jgi:hypothetical protein